MYHDLQLKGESCKNEPEFRAYIILLNLNDGNFMWEVGKTVYYSCGMVFIVNRGKLI
jgi:hypothetical protein